MATWLQILSRCVWAGGMSAAAAALPEGPGLAAQYPGDRGLEQDPAVVFAENFEAAGLDEISRRWDHTNNRQGKAVELSELTPEASAGVRSLRMTATRGENEGGHLFKVLRPGHDRLFLRFYVRFGDDNGFNHHFVSLGGEVDPPPYPVGRAGLRPDNRWNTGIEPVRQSLQGDRPIAYPPPGIWHFYTYWPEMRSWQNPDGTGTSFYGNNFEPPEPVAAPRGQWIAVEIMVQMNTSPQAADGEQAVWIDGKRAAHYGPGTVVGRWVRDSFRLDPTGAPFEGFRWRCDPRVNINKLWLSHYVSEDAFRRTDQYAAAHPDARVNTRQAAVWFDDLVLATTYIGPISAPAEAAAGRTPAPARPARGPRGPAPGRGTRR